MDDDECIHGLPPMSCTICLHGITRPEPVAIEAIFQAAFDGQCGECNLPIHAKQWICRLSTGAFVHRWCAP